MNCWRFIRKFNFFLAFILLLTLNVFADYQIKSDDVRVDSSAFSGNLPSSANTVQKALKVFDEFTGMSYPGAGIPISTGSAWGTSLTDNHSNWDTAYGWGNHANAGYLTAETDPVVKAINGIVKSNGTTISAVQSGTDIKTINGASILGNGDITVSSADEKIKYDATDTASGYLGAKTVAGTGISLSEGTSGDADKLVITNSAPDQTVSLSSGTGINVSGTYPSFTIANTGVTAESDPVWVTASGNYYLKNQATPQTITGQINSIPSSETQVGQIIQGKQTLLTQAAPNTISGLVAWYKADAETGLNDGDPVSTMTDQSGSGNNATGTLTARPTYKINIVNSKPVYRFDGINDRMDTGVFQGATWIFVGNYTGGSTWAHIVGLLNGATSHFIYGGTGGTTLITGGSGSQTTYVNNVATTTFTPMSTFKILLAGWTNMNGNWCIGRLDNDTKFWTGDFAEIIAYNKVLTTRERNQIELYLAAKYSISAYDINIVDTTQSADLAQWKNPAGTTLGSIDYAGQYHGNVVGGTVSATTLASGRSNLTITESIDNSNIFNRAYSVIDLNNNVTGGYHGSAISFSSQGTALGYIAMQTAGNNGLYLNPLSPQNKVYFGGYNTPYYIDNSLGELHFSKLYPTGGISMDGGSTWPYSIIGVRAINMGSGYGVTMNWDGGSIRSDNITGNVIGIASGTTPVWQSVNKPYRLMATDVNGYTDINVANPPFFKNDRVGFGVATADDMLARVHSVAASVCSGTPDACSTFGTQTPCDAQGGCGWVDCTAYNNQQGPCQSHGSCSWGSDGPCSNWNGSSETCSAEGCGYSDCSAWNGTDSGTCTGGHNGCSWQTAPCSGIDPSTCQTSPPSGCGWSDTGCGQWGADSGTCTGHSCMWSSSDCHAYDNTSDSTCNGNSGCSWAGTDCHTWDGTSQGTCEYYGSCVWDGSFSYCDGSSGCENYGNSSDCDTDPSQYGGCTSHYVNSCTGTATSGSGSCNGEYNTSCSGSYYECTGSYDTGVCAGTTCDGTSTGGTCSGSYCGGTASLCNTFATSGGCGGQAGCDWVLGDSFYGDGDFHTATGFKGDCVADSVIQNNSFFCGSDHSNKACYKDGGGAVHVLY